MRYFLNLSGMVFKRFMSPISIILLVLLLVLAMFSVQLGIREKKKVAENISEFQNLEITFFKYITNYTLYSNLGFKVISITGDSSIFYSHPEILTDMSARVNSIITLDIMQNIRSGIMLKGNSAFSFRFSSIIKVLGSLLVLFLGIGTMRNREFFKSLSCQWPPWLIHLTILLSQGLIIVVLLLFMFSICLGLAALQGLSFTSPEISGHLHVFISALLFLLIFFVIGVLLGYIKSKYAGFIGILTVWILSIFFYPSAINFIFGVKTFDTNTSYKFDANKLKIVNEFENRVAAEFGEYKNVSPEVRRRVIEGYFQSDFKLIEAEDEQQKQELSGLIDNYSQLMVWMPTTFYELTVNEASSRGYLSYLDFYSYLQERRREFFLFWKDRVYYQDPKVMVNFVKGNENLFFSRSHIPKAYWQGVLISLVYILVLGIASHILFLRSTRHMGSKEVNEMGNVSLQVDRGDLKIWLTRKEHLKKLLFNLFIGRLNVLKKSRSNIEVLIDKVDVAKTVSKHKVVYICHQDELPGDMKVKDLLFFYSRWRKIAEQEAKTLMDQEDLKPILNKTIVSLEPVQSFEVVLALVALAGLSNSDLYLIDDLCKFLPLSCAVKLLNQMEELKEKAMVIYLVHSGVSGQPPLEENQYYGDDVGWEHKVLSEKAILRMKAKIKKEKSDER